ncbi:hypothetical protein D3C87_1907180 [compost metagenome]
MGHIIGAVHLKGQISGIRGFPVLFGVLHHQLPVIGPLVAGRSLKPLLEKRRRKLLPGIIYTLGQ